MQVIVMNLQLRTLAVKRLAAQLIGAYVFAWPERLLLVQKRRKNRVDWICACLYA